MNKLEDILHRVETGMTTAEDAEDLKWLLQDFGQCYYCEELTTWRDLRKMKDSRWACGACRVNHYNMLGNRVGI